MDLIRGSEMAKEIDGSTHRELARMIMDRQLRLLKTEHAPALWPRFPIKLRTPDLNGDDETCPFRP